MSVDLVLMAFIVGGMGLTLAYVRAEIIASREAKTAAQKRAIALRELSESGKAAPGEREAPATADAEARPPCIRRKLERRCRARADKAA